MNETAPSRLPTSGKLHLQFESAAGQTILRRREQRPPLQVVRGFSLSGGGVLAHVHNVSGGVLAGDQLEMVVDVCSGARAQLTSTGATRIYRRPDEGAAAWQVSTINIGENGLLEYLPDPLIPFAGSSYRQETMITLGEDAGLFWWEIVSPGREACGEIFQYDTLEISLEIQSGGRPVAMEQVRLEPGRRPPGSPARLGQYRYFATFYICRQGLEATRWGTLEVLLGDLAGRLSRPGEILWGASMLLRDGLVVRALSLRGRDIPPGLFQFWSLAKQELYGEDAVLPRKVY